MLRFSSMVMPPICSAALATAARVLLLSILILAPVGIPAPAATPSTVPPGQGVNLGTLHVGAITYRQVTLMSVNARTIVIRHSGGMASIRLSDLPPELQSRFGYDPAAESAANEALNRATEPPTKSRQQPPGVQAKPADSASKFEELLMRFGQKPELRSETSLRPRFLQLDLGVKDQGRRASCAVFAVVGALEYQNAELTGQAEQFSEEYLLWATRQTLHRELPPVSDSSSDTTELSEGTDEGFSLADVLLALRTYGIPPRSAMPNAGYTKITDTPAPPADLINQARTHRRVFVHRVPGHDTAEQLDNAILALNAGVPVVIGLRWPNERSIRAGFISEQAPLTIGAHAVTLVGYQNSGGQSDGTTFVFKNSYGPTWGEAGYGRVTYDYLQNNLLDAALLEIEVP